ncbi:hypothetical protein [Sagittula salina]|uniref:Uncharacterized protein n=1 Tax=Sagittula salina TaxID=2820268 RepID=A0A940MSF1_9RHOB|nr:hypothetical protein [Sagittula salina]MBP0484980.1 hypothetical protein [Sagittula salina]
MSFLPYGRGTPGGWILSGLVSVALHVGAIAALGLSVSQWFLERPLPLARPEFQITLEQLESDTLAGIVEQLGDAAGSDTSEDLTAADPEGDLSPEIPDDILPEDITAETGEELLASEGEDLAAEPLDATAPEDFAPDEITPDEVAADELVAEELTGEDIAADEPPAPDLAQVEPEDLAPEDLSPEEIAPQPEAEALTADAEPEDIAPQTEPEELVSDLQTEEIAPEIPPETPAEPSPAELIVEEIQPETAVEPLVPEAVQTVEAPEDLTPESAPAEPAPLDSVEALEPSAVTPDLIDPEVTELAPLEETLPAPVEDFAALDPGEPLVGVPTPSDDPLIVEDGAGLVLGGAPPPAEADSLNPIIAEEAPPVSPPAEETAGVEPDALVPEDLAALAPLQPQLPASGVPDTIEPTVLPLEPQVITPEDPVPDVPAPDVPVQETPVPEVIAPTEVLPDTVAPEVVEPDVVEPTEVPAQQVPADATASEITGTEITGTEPRRRALPPRVVRRPRAAPSERDLAIGDLIQRIRARTEDNCVIALPRRDGADGIGLALLAAEDGAMVDFADKVLVRPEDKDILQTRTLLDERQCPALSYIAKNRDYPATRIGMRLDNAEVPSGNRASGVMRGVGDRNLGLFLVDNNGVVQDLARFTTESDGFVRFDVPVTRVGPLRDTKQLLLAIATTEPLDVLKARSGQRAETFFADLPIELGRQAALALVAFDVR